MEFASAAPDPVCRTAVPRDFVACRCRAESHHWPAVRVEPTAYGWPEQRKGSNMNMSIRVAAAVLAALVMAGCASSPDADRAGKDRKAGAARPIPAEAARFDGPEGRGFPYYLADGYWIFAKQEDNEHHFIEAEKFRARAAAVERGDRVDPEALSQRQLPDFAVADLAAARERLMRAFRDGARSRLPKLAARAQVAFDCWMEEQEENLQPQDIAACRKQFEEAMDLIEAELRPPAAVAQPAAQPCVPQCPRASCVECRSSFIVYFEFDRSHLTDEGRGVIATAIAEATATRPERILVAGHADRAGPLGYNDALSKARVEAVLKALRDGGLSGERLMASHFGETRPRVMTPDGERHAENRRVEIRFEWK